MNSILTCFAGAVKTRTPLSLGIWLAAGLGVPQPGWGAESAAPAYQFKPGQTNVYAVEGSLEADEAKLACQGTVIMTVTEARDSQVTLGWAGRLLFKHEGPGGFGMPRPGAFRPLMNRPIGFSHGAEVVVDSKGRLLSSYNDAQLPLQAGGLATCLVVPLPTNRTEALTVSAEILVPDDSPRRGLPPMMGGYYDPSTGMMRQPGANMVAERHIRIAVEPGDQAHLTVVREAETRSLAVVSGSPRLHARAKTKGTFDATAGIMREVTFEYTETTAAKTVSRRAEFTLHARLLEGEERLAALKPVLNPGESQPKKLTAEEVRAALEDLKSEERRGEAESRLMIAEFGALPPDLANQAAELMTEPAGPSRSVAAKILAAAATSEHVPLLLKQLGEEDWSIRNEVVEALGRIKDKRAIEPLAELIARGEMDRSQAAEALGKFGPAAEDAALGLLKEKGLETRREACRILGRVGTERSLKALQEAMIDRDDNLRQAASEAVGEIRKREQ